MKPFDYQKYLKNNPLLKESINEVTLKNLIKPLVAKLESMGYEVDSDPTPGFQTLEAFKTYPDGSILRMYLTPSDKEVDQRRDMPDDNRGLGDYSTLDVSFTYWPIQVTKKFFGLFKSKERMMQDLPDEAGRNIDLGTGMFDIPVEDSVNRVIGLLKKAEQKVSGGTPTRQTTGDADADFMGEAKDNDSWFLDANAFNIQSPSYGLKPTDRVSIGNDKAMTYADALKKYGSKQAKVTTPPGASPEKVAIYILKQLKKNYTDEELQDMSMQDAIDTVKSYGFEGSEVEEIVDWINMML
jgi:hypothetical protein